MPEVHKLISRIQRKQPAHPWGRIWQNISRQPLSTTIRAMWFRAVHDIIPNNARLYSIRLRDTPLCSTCGQTDTTLHRVMSCLGAREVWIWTRFRLALMLRLDPRHVPFTWVLFPALNIWPPPRQNAILWVLGHMDYFTLQDHPALELQDYIDFLRRPRWKTCRWCQRNKVYGNYLDVLD